MSTIHLATAESPPSSIPPRRACRADRVCGSTVPARGIYLTPRCLSQTRSNWDDCDGDVHNPRECRSLPERGLEDQLRFHHMPTRFPANCKFRLTEAWYDPDMRRLIIIHRPILRIRSCSSSPILPVDADELAHERETISDREPSEPPK